MLRVEWVTDQVRWRKGRGGWGKGVVGEGWYLDGRRRVIGFVMVVVMAVVVMVVVDVVVEWDRFGWM
jgi:hypothetical protein